MYDKSDVNDLDDKGRILITCPVHGDYRQDIKNHLKGHGCTQCAIDKTKGYKVTTEEFIKRSTIVHKGKYDYSLTDMEHPNEKGQVCIICPVHGIFWQHPRYHMNGEGCLDCGGRKKKTQKEFLKQLHEVWNDEYDTRDTIYINNKTPVILYCKKHGRFERTPKELLKHKGCQECGKEKAAEARRMPVEEFIKRANIVHNNKYIYTEVKYRNNLVDVDIICPIHGIFHQSPGNHLAGKGCYLCGREEAIKKLRMPFEEFVKRARAIHGDKYQYVEETYVDLQTEMDMICPIHGKFAQKPVVHLGGNGCQKCSQPRLETFVTRILESNNIVFEWQKKYEWTGRKSYDFYIPDKNLLIECQGMQHYKAMEFFGGKNAFNAQVHNDKEKERLAKEHGIDMLYILPPKKVDYKNEIFEELYIRNPTYKLEEFAALVKKDWRN